MDEMEQWDDVLPVGSVLRSGKREYRVEAVLGKGGFGITYKVSAMEQVGQIPVRVEFAMKEFSWTDVCAMLLERSARLTQRGRLPMA